MIKSLLGHKTVLIGKTKQKRMTKKKCFNCCLKYCKDEALVTFSGRLFQIGGAATVTFWPRWLNFGQLERPGDDLMKSEGLVG